MFGKHLYRIFVTLILIVESLSVTGPVRALGTPQIVSIDPSSGPAGTSFTIHATVTWDNDFRAIRMCFLNGSNCHESGAPDITSSFNTDGLAPGTYYVTVQVAGKGDNDWLNPTWTSGTFQVTENPQPNNPPPSNPSISCSVDAFDVWPNPANIGDNIHITGGGSCNTGVRAVKVKIDGGDYYEIGNPNLDTTWSTNGVSVGQHKLKLMIAGQGDNNWDYAATQIINIQLNAQGQPSSGNQSPFSTSDLININGDIYVIIANGGSVERRHVPNPDTLDALGISRAWIDNKGWSSSDLKSIHRGDDIPDVNIDPSGFATFKAQYFPTTAPITPGGNVPTASVGPTGTVGDCPAAPAQIKPGDKAVLTGKDLNLRPQASVDNTPITIIPNFSQVLVVSGPVCSGGTRWFEVKYDGNDGWAAEVGSGGEYHIVPNGQQQAPAEPVATDAPAQIAPAIPVEPPSKGQTDQPKKNACFFGSRIGLVSLQGEWHHYVEFDIGPDYTNSGWKVSGPLWPTVWGTSDSTHVRAGFRWPWDWKVIIFWPSLWSLCTL